MAEPFDLIVIGTGSGGSAPAYRCRKAGWRVAVVDEVPYGGTCAVRGCDPKKVLVGAAELVDWQRRMRGHGVTGQARIAWGDLMRFKRTFTDPVPDHREAGFASAGIATLHGSARFVAPDALAVGGDVLRARHFVIASGAEPRHLEFPGAEHLRTSTDFLDLDELPARIVFVGGGYVSFEFAHIAVRAGAAVTIVARGRPLRRFEPDLVDRLVAHTRRLGITVRSDAEVSRVEQVDGGFRVYVTNAGKTEMMDADLVVHGAGRVPATAHLALDKAEVATSLDGGVAVDEYLRSTTNPLVYAAGDVTTTPGSLPLTPVAGYEGSVVASNLLQNNHRRAQYGAIPSVVFTVPTLATVGLTQAAAVAQGVDVRVETHDTTGWFTNRRLAAECGMAMVLIEKGTDRVVGAHLLGQHTEELVNVFALGMNHGIPALALRHHLYAYPTTASDIPYLV